MLHIMKASAGSGKTYNLALKYITLLLTNKDKYAYRHILAVTFTNKATDEMKERILKELYILSSHPSTSKYRNEFIPGYFGSEEELSKKAREVLQGILHDYSAFAVSTIDRFFQQTLKAFSREIGNFAAYKVELDRESLVSECVDRILDSLTEKDADLLNWITTNVISQVQEGKKFKADANLQDAAKRLMHQQREDLTEQYDIDIQNSFSKSRLATVDKECKGLIKTFMEELEDKAQCCLNLIRDSGVNPKDSKNGFLSQLYKYQGLKAETLIEKPTATFFTNGENTDNWFAKTKKDLFDKLYPSLEGPLDDFLSMWGEKFNVYQTAFILKKQLFSLGVIAEISSTFQELTKEKNVICLDDSNRLLRRIIDESDAPFVYEKLGVRYEHFLLDEFQDTSSVQWQNFRPLVTNSHSQGGDNLIVGDIKQSIYRWRGSEWKLLGQIVPSEFKDSTNKPLVTNYRSRSQIIHFNNDFFVKAIQVLAEKTENKELLEIYADVEQKVSSSNDSKPEGCMKVSFCKEESMLNQVLESVHQAVEAGARLSEITILVRNNKAGGEIANHLIANGIDIVTDDSLTVKSSLTVRRILSLLSYMDNPADTVNSYLAEKMNIVNPETGMSLTDLVEWLYRKVVEVDADGVWKGELPYIQSFMDHLQEYVASNGNNIRGFLKYCDEKKLYISSPSSGESVTIMTVHKAKGLAFPYVILPYAEQIDMYKAGKRWCCPDFTGTPFDGVAEGIYDVTLSERTEDSLFKPQYESERFLQLVDNLNILYVAMTRPVLGMHIISAVPSKKFTDSLKKDAPEFGRMSHLLYWYVLKNKAVATVEDGVSHYFFGTMPDFNNEREEETQEATTFPIDEGGEFPSIPLNKEEMEDDEDVRTRGRLKFSADSLDFFNPGASQFSSSDRLRGVVLHDIMSRVNLPSDLKGSVDVAVASGQMTAEEGQEAYVHLEDAIAKVSERGWFEEGHSLNHNELSVMDTDGRVYRPDRVIYDGEKVLIIDYKFGEHMSKYEKQVLRYMSLWKRMGYAQVCGYLWYVDSGDIRDVLSK